MATQQFEGQAETDPQYLLAEGIEVEGYRVAGKPIASSELAIVVPAVNNDSLESVVLKISRGGISNGVDADARISHEMTMHNAFSDHPAIVTVDGFGTWRERPFLATRYQDLGSLRSHIGDTADIHDRTTEQLSAAIEEIDQDIKQLPPGSEDMVDVPMLVEVVEDIRADVVPELRHIAEAQEAVDIVVDAALDLGHDVNPNGEFAMQATKQLLEEAKITIPEPEPEIGVRATKDILGIVGDVGGALAVMHAQGIVHRDVKPHNVLVNRRGRGRLSDFGIAMYAGQEGVELEGNVSGTRGYMSVEAYTGIVHARGDISALAVTAYEALAGEKPFQVDTTKNPREDLAVLLDTQPVPLGARNKHVPIEISRLVMGVLIGEDEPSAERLASVLSKV
jgi:serine/threonine protein kinase